MKRLNMFLCLLCVFALLLSTTFASSPVAEELVLPDNAVIDGMEYYPFVYSEDDGFAWFREFIGDCSGCVPGYLYVQDLSTREIWQVIDQPVDLYRSSGETLYCIVDGWSIVQTNYWGQNPTVIYTSAYGDIDNMEFDNGCLYFSDGDYVICLDLVDNTAAELAFCEGITFLFPVTENTFAWMSDGSETYLYYIDTGAEEVVDLIDLFQADITYEVEQITAPASPLAIRPETFPLSEYPSGSYFTQNGEACKVHDKNCSYYGGCNCLVYRASIQCAGFAKYAFDRYSHLYPNTASWYSDNDPHTNILKTTFSSDADVWILFSSLGYGTYMRLTRPSDNYEGDYINGDHSIVTAGGSSTSITFYEGNADGHCKVMMTTYTLAKFRATFPYVIKTVAHSFSGSATAYSDDYHKVMCSYSGCTGYVLQSHTIINSVCIVCRYKDRNYEIMGNDRSLKN